MSTHATAVFEIKTWDEKPYQEIEGGSKLTRASVTKTYRGNITGDATSESLMFYRADGSAVFAGLERIVGSIGGRAGSFVLQVSGPYRDGTATCDCTVAHLPSKPWTLAPGGAANARVSAAAVRPA